MASRRRRYYSPELANRALPLVRAIVVDVAETAQGMSRAWQDAGKVPEHSERRSELIAEIRRLEQRFRELTSELEQLGVELKDPYVGLIDFRARRAGRDVYLCWKIGEPSVGHWHPLNSGFKGRRPISTFAEPAQREQ